MSTPSTHPDDPRAELRRILPAKLVLALHHLVKASALYDSDNHAVTSLVAVVKVTIAELCAALDAPHARVLFADRVVFVNGRILKGTHEAQGVTHELGALIARAGASDLTFDRRVPGESLTAFARAVAGAPHDPDASRRLLEGQVPGVVARWVDPAVAETLPDVERSPAARVILGYASAVLLLRRAFEALSRGDLLPSGRARRVAQKLLALCDEDPDLTAALAAAPFPDDDPARVAVSTAVVAVAMARHLTADPLVLAALAAAALLADAGRLRIGDLPSGRDRWAASALVVTGALGRLDPGSAARDVIAHEALRLEHGPALAGVEPLVLARVLFAARRFNALRVPPPGSAGAGIGAAVEILRREAAGADARLYLDLLVSALGFFPPGTLVELSTGEIAVVTAVPSSSVDFASPEVRLLANARGAQVDGRVDLARPPPGQPKRRIRRALSADRDLLAALYERLGPRGLR